jgi:uncharacterized membrane protein
MSDQDQPVQGPEPEPAEVEHAEHAEFAERAEFAEFAEHAEFAEFAEHAEHAQRAEHPEGGPDPSLVAETMHLAAETMHEEAMHHRMHHLLGRQGAGGATDAIWRSEMLHLLEAANKLSSAGLSRLHRQEKAEPRWPVSTAVIFAIVLQALLPPGLRLRPEWLHYVLFGLEGAMLIMLFISNPIRIERMSRPVRTASIFLIFLITASNTVSALSLVREIVTNHLPASQSAQHAAVELFLSGAAIWGTNVIAFALWYWEFDRGGPVSRLEGRSPYVDLLFTQMSEPELTRPGWGPHFIDYLYFSFTNATAFSPTDVLPFARWAKLTMLVQSAVSLVLGVLVIARAVNILPLQ